MRISKPVAYLSRAQSTSFTPVSRKHAALYLNQWRALRLRVSSIRTAEGVAVYYCRGADEALRVGARS